jgi:hypothetical protein
MNIKQAATDRCLSGELPKLEMLGPRSLPADKEKAMNPWSDYLRAQAVLADRIAKTMTTAARVKEFADYAEGYRRDADAEDRTPIHIKEGRSVQ